MKYLIIIIIILILLSGGSDKSMEYDCYKKKAELRGIMQIEC